MTCDKDNKAVFDKTMDCKRKSSKELTDEEIIDSILEHDYIVKMSPIKRYTVKVKIRSIKKAEPKAVEPDIIYDE